jgi:micrococcal nuclease
VAHAQCVTKTSSTHNVAQVIDGNTVRLDNESEVRLIGALAPETPRWWKGKGAWPPADFTRKELEKLIGSHKVEIRFAGDEEPRDRHDRYLAQMFVRRDEERIWVQGHMIRNGLSQAYSLKGHRACARALQEEELSARNSHRGLWRKDRFKVLQTNNTDGLSMRQGSFQVVEGTVHTVSKKSQWTFLNFSAD